MKFILGHNRSQSSVRSISSKAPSDNEATAGLVTDVDVQLTNEPEQGGVYYGGQSITGHVSFRVLNPNQFKEAMVRLKCRAIDRKSVVPFLVTKIKCLDIWESRANLELNGAEEKGSDVENYAGDFILSIPQHTAPSLDLPQGPKIIYLLCVCVRSKSLLARRQVVDRQVLRILPRVPIVHMKSTLNSGYVKGHGDLSGLEMQCILYHTHVILSQGIRIYLCVRNKKRACIHNVELTLYRTVLIEKNKHRERLFKCNVPQFTECSDLFSEKNFRIKFPNNVYSGLVSHTSPQVTVEFDLIVTLTSDDDEKLYWVSPIVVCNAE